MNETPQSGATLDNRFTVAKDDTAVAWGSGSLEVLATPRLAAWCESMTCAMVEDSLPVGHTSVGTRVNIAHKAPSGVGAQVQITVRLVDADNRRLSFHAVAHDVNGLEIATADIERVVVDTGRFMGRADR